MHFVIGALIGAVIGNTTAKFVSFEQAKKFCTDILDKSESSEGESEGESEDSEDKS